MSEISWRQLADACIEKNGTAVLLIPGSPPAIRLPDAIWPMDVPALSCNDVAQILSPYMPPAKWGLKKGHIQVRDGYIGFLIRHSDEWWFHANVFKDAPVPMAIVMRVTAEQRAGGAD